MVLLIVIKSRQARLTAFLLAFLAVVLVRGK